MPIPVTRHESDILRQPGGRFTSQSRSCSGIRSAIDRQKTRNACIETHRAGPNKRLGSVAVRGTRLRLGRRSVARGLGLGRAGGCRRGRAGQSFRRRLRMPGRYRVGRPSPRPAHRWSSRRWDDGRSARKGIRDFLRLARMGLTLVNIPLDSAFWTGEVGPEAVARRPGTVRGLELCSRRRGRRRIRAATLSGLTGSTGITQSLNPWSARTSFSPDTARYGPGERVTASQPDSHRQDGPTWPQADCGLRRRRFGSNTGKSEKV